MPKVLRKMLAVIAVVVALALFELAAATDTPSPNEPIPKPPCEPMKIQLHYKRSISDTSPPRVTIRSLDGTTRGGCVRLSQIWRALGTISPVLAVDPVTGEESERPTGTWLLTEDLFVEDGITLLVHGTSVRRGDTDELRLLSKNRDDFVLNLRGYGGSLDFLSTKVFAWDRSKNAVDEEEEGGRSFISVVSEVVDRNTTECDGKAQKNQGQARMDIEDSEMAYLGYQGSESYGLTWKVRGLCKDLSNVDMFEYVNVYGNIYDSDIHHNRFGVYTYGHQQGDWRRNKMHDNSGYGFDPHDDSDLLTIHDNEVYNNMYHGIIASKRCNGVSIQGNEVYGGGEKSAGIFLHRSGDDAIVKGNDVHDNGDAGMAMLESFRADVSNNVFNDNKYGVRFSVGCGDNVFTNNQFIDSSKYNVFSYAGTDEPDVSDSRRSYDNIFRNNKFIGGEESIKLKEADGFQFVDNIFTDASVVRFDETEDTLMSGNTGLDDVEVKRLGGSCFDDASDSEWSPSC